MNEFVMSGVMLVVILAFGFYIQYKSLPIRRIKSDVVRESKQITAKLKGISGDHPIISGISKVSHSQARPSK